MSETLTGNSNVSHYRIVSKIGTGGMGEVYLAEDTRLHRKIAIKLLNNELCENDSLQHHLKREARAASALNHPNIVTIYEISELNGTRCFIAMEFVEGSNVRQLIKKRKLKLDETLDVAIQTASALAAAHAAGIVHRDIKPENIMRRPDGLIKVLDFGLAKQTIALTEPNQVDSEAVTREEIKTTSGLIMGTMPYMSPEHIRGNRVDARTDIWSLGIVLYEMITGHLPFNGETGSDLSAEILKNKPPPLSFYKPNIPIELEHIVKKALGKDCDERYQVIKDFLLDLKTFRSEIDSVIKVSDSGSISAVGASAEMHAKARESAKTGNLAIKPYLRQAIPAFILLPTIFLGYYWWRQNQETKPSEPISLASSQVTSWKSGLGANDESRARFSPDGKLIAFVASKDGSRDIWLKQIDGGEPFTLKQDDSLKTSPLFSYDGGRIAYISERGGRRGIWASPTLGGAPMLLSPLNARRNRLVYWSKDGATVYFDMEQNLYALDVAAKQITKLTNFEESQAIERGFSFSPDEQRIVYADRKGGQKDLWTTDRNGENAVRLTQDAAVDSYPVWHPDGQRIIYSSDRNGVRQIYTAYLDGRVPVPLTSGDSDSDVSDISADGTKILYQTTKDDSDLWGVSLNTGKEFQLTLDIGSEFWLDAAPDGETVAYQAVRRTSIGSKPLNCLLLSQKVKSDSRQIQLAPDGFAPRWSPDGSQLAFLRSEAENYSIWVTSATGGDARKLSEGVVFNGFSRLPLNRLQTQDYQWSPDGHSLIYCANREGISNIWQVSTDGTGEKQLTNNDDKDLRFFNPLSSSDGGRIAWLVRSTNNQKKTSWSVWVFENGNVRQIYQSNFLLGLVGWSLSGNELIIKSVESSGDIQKLPVEVNLFQLALDGSAPRSISKLKETYFQNIQLSPDRKTLAFVTRQNGEGTIQIIPSTGGAAKTVISSNDARLYFSSLAFAPDGKTIYYGKQANWQVISIINNFK